MYFGLLSTYDQNCNTTSEVWSYLVLTSSGQNYIYSYCNTTSWVIRRALNLNTRSWHVVGSIARSTALTSSSVMGEDSLVSERDDFDIGSKEDNFSSLTTNVLVSYIPRNRAILKQRTWCNLWLYDCNSNFTCVVRRMKKLHTGSIFIFLEVAPLEVFASPPPDFLLSGFGWRCGALSVRVVLEQVLAMVGYLPVGQSRYKDDFYSTRLGLLRCPTSYERICEF